MPATRLVLEALPGLPDIQPGADLPALISQSLKQMAWQPTSGDVLCVSSKIVSKAENRFVLLTDIVPSARAHELAAVTHKSPKMVELVLRESTLVSRAAPYVLVVRHKLGFVCANAGIDQSNLGESYADYALLLPENPDASAGAIADAVHAETGQQLAVVITDTHGRPFRMGNLNVAIGISGIPAVLDERGHPDRYGRTLHNTITAFADQIAAAAGLITGESSAGQPAVIVRGLQWEGYAAGNSEDLSRPTENDLYLKN
jgi:coenzyme F420-0:L-glutamate ligase / coenzyme F420-1:gamma-L-glutamate ligase